MGDTKKLMTIGEIAKVMGITRRIIINYEERGLITPDVREGDTGYRYYTLDMLTRIRTIRIFQNMGLTLDEIRDYFDDSTDLTPMLARLETLRDELNLNIEKIRERINAAGETEIRFVSIPRQTVYCREFRMSDDIEERKSLLRETTRAALLEYGSDITRRMFFAEFSLDDPNLVSCCAAVPSGSRGEHIRELPEIQAICIHYHGGYEGLPAVRARLVDYAREHNIKLPGSCRHIYLEGPPQHRDPAKFITQVALAVEDRRRG